MATLVDVLSSDLLQKVRAVLLLVPQILLTILLELEAPHLRDLMLQSIAATLLHLNMPLSHARFLHAVLFDGIELLLEGRERVLDAQSPQMRRDFLLEALLPDLASALAHIL